MDKFEILNIVDNKEKHQYELHIGDSIVRIVYEKNDNGEILLTHTEVPDVLQGQGIAGILTKKVLNRIKEEGLIVIPVCPYIIKYVEKNPEWKSITITK